MVNKVFLKIYLLSMLNILYLSESFFFRYTPYSRTVRKAFYTNRNAWFMTERERLKIPKKTKRNKYIRPRLVAWKRRRRRRPIKSVVLYYLPTAMGSKWVQRSPAIPSVAAIHSIYKITALKSRQAGRAGRGIPLTISHIHRSEHQYNT